MAYADSALDYSFEIHAINVNQGLMTVRFYTDSSDTDRPDVYRNINLTDTQFNDSDIQVLAKQSASGVVAQWDQIIERNAANPTFNGSDFVGDAYSTRYIPSVFDSYPIGYNQLYYKVSQGQVNDSYEYRTTYTLTAMSDSEKSDFRGGLSITRSHLWNTLLGEGKLDSATTALGLYTGSHDSEEIAFLVGDTLPFNSSLLVGLRSTLGYSNDSDFAAIYWTDLTQ